LRTLFFRIFISFWLAMAMILAGAIAITATVAWYRIAMLSSIDPGELMNDATAALRNQGISGLKSWLETITSAHPDLDIYVVDPSGKDVLLRPLPERIEQWLVLDGGPRRGKDGSFNASYWPYGYDWSPHGLTKSHSSDFNRSHLLANPKILGEDGSNYTLLVAWFGATPMDEIGSDGVVYVLFAIALGISAVICWWLARYISAPVAGLQLSARTLALGNFEAQVDEKFCKRRDELGILARDFNQMAARLHSQIASKEVLLRDISHELRSPLTRLRVALGLARRGGSNIEIQFNRIERDIERLDALIGETLQLSRLSGPVPTFVCETVELGLLLNEVVEDAQLEASASGKLVDPSAIVDLCVEGNPELLRRAIDNVLRNAIRFEPPGGNIEVSTRVDGSGATIVVRDHGCGVPEPDLERIFEVFYRVAEARERSSGGTGLGLAITARIMALHGGHSRARNAPDGGLIVELHLPHAIVPSEPLSDAATDSNLVDQPVVLSAQVDCLAKGSWDRSLRRILTRGLAFARHLPSHGRLLKPKAPIFGRMRSRSPPAASATES
jgi:two-component system, OmpR family, sensor kinase